MHISSFWNFCLLVHWSEKSWHECFCWPCFPSATFHSNIQYWLLQWKLLFDHERSTIQLEAATEAATRSMLGGKVNPSMLSLKHLNYLDLAWNNFGVEIPRFILTVSILQYHIGCIDLAILGTFLYLGMNCKARFQML